MAGSGAFITFVVEQMARATQRAVRARRLFGGHGIFDGELMFAIVVDDVLYLKADATTAREFEALGLRPFTYTARGRTVVTSYYETPPEAFEQEAVMRTWMRKALDVALRSHAPASPRKAVRKAATKRKTRAA